MKEMKGGGLTSSPSVRMVALKATEAPRAIARKTPRYGRPAYAPIAKRWGETDRRDPLS
jgi:hypothetical protein